MASILPGKRWRKLKPGMDLYVQGLSDDANVLSDGGMENQSLDVTSVSPKGSLRDHSGREGVPGVVIVGVDCAGQLP